MSQKILITGSNVGFGNLTAKTLLSHGFNVAASMRDPQGRNKTAADELSKLGAIVVNIDVTDEQSVMLGVEQAVTELGGLDAVINNAGFGILGVSEAFTVDDWKNVFEVNVFGVQRVVRATLPYLRKQKSGSLIFLSSVGGRVAFPFYGPYSASKFALEALAETYSYELNQFNINVSIVEPGGFNTAFISNIKRPSDTPRAKEYGELANFGEQLIQGFEASFEQHPEQDPIIIAQLIEQLLTSDNPPLRVVADKLAFNEPITKYNQEYESMINNLFESFGMSDTFLKR